MNMRIMKTLIKKDYKNCLANKNLLLSLAIPVFFCLLYDYLFQDKMEMSGIYVLQMCAVFAISIVPTTILPMMIAEEKEKYTLRSLMLARVEGIEFLLGKLGVCLSLTFVDAVLVFLIAGGEKEDFIIYGMMVLIASLGLSFLGAVAGLLSKDQASAGTVGAPLLLITMLPPLLAGMNETLSRIAVLVPTTSFQTIFLSMVKDERFWQKENIIALIVCLVWIVGGYVIFHIFYKKRGIDY